MPAASESKPAKRRTTVERRGDREVAVTREFDAPARIVYEAWTRPELLRQWWAPRSMGMVLESVELDVRVGGGYRLVFGGGFAFFGKYLEVVPNSRLVWTNEESGEAGQISTLTFEEKNGKTVLVLHELYPSKQALDEGGGAADAMDEMLGQLEALLASR